MLEVATPACWGLVVTARSALAWLPGARAQPCRVLGEGTMPQRGTKCGERQSAHRSELQEETHTCWVLSKRDLTGWKAPRLPEAWEANAEGAHAPGGFQPFPPWSLWSPWRAGVEGGRRGAGPVQIQLTGLGCH